MNCHPDLITTYPSKPPCIWYCTLRQTALLDGDHPDPEYRQADSASPSPNPCVRTLYPRFTINYCTSAGEIGSWGKNTSTRNALTFVNITVIAYRPKISRSLKIWLVCKSSCVHKRQSITSNGTRSRNGLSSSSLSVLANSSYPCVTVKVKEQVIILGARVLG